MIHPVMGGDLKDASISYSPVLQTMTFEGIRLDFAVPPKAVVFSHFGSRDLES